jgi:hypothetical protein
VGGWQLAGEFLSLGVYTTAHRCLQQPDTLFHERPTDWDVHQATRILVKCSSMTPEIHHPHVRWQHFWHVFRKTVVPRYLVVGDV